MNIKYSKVIYEPQSEPVTVDEAKRHLRVTNNSDDTYILGLIKAVRIMAERYTGLSFVTQTRQMRLDSFPCQMPDNPRAILELPYGPVLAISGSDTATTPNTLGVQYANDADGTTTLVLNTDFRIDSDAEIARLESIDGWPSDLSDQIKPVTITYTAGYLTVPQVIKQAIFLGVGSLYENRQDEVPGSMEKIHWTSMTLLDAVKVYWNAKQED
jgi:uncharacterized phiE125 gp8 family phage protein